MDLAKGQSENPPMLPCALCTKSFKYRSKLLRHELSHTKTKLFSCCYCEKKFSLSYNLNVHKRIHTGTKPYICTFTSCRKAFTQSNNLKVHLKTHKMPSNLLPPSFILEILRQKQEKLLNTQEESEYSECDSETTLGEVDTFSQLGS